MSQKSKPSPKPSPRNTLFNYFSKNTSNTPQNVEKSTEKPKAKIGIEKLSGKKLDFGKRSSVQDSSDEEDVISNKSKKRKIIDSDEEDDTENNINSKNKIEKEAAAATVIKRPKVESDEEETPISKLARFAEDRDDDDDEDVEMKTPAKKLSKLKVAHDDDEENSNEALSSLDNEITVYKHENFEFLKPEHIRDINKNRPNHPDYDNRTLYVPPDFLKTVTPGHLQWWSLKAQYFDCIFFFKVGKFYELYHQDAVIGVKELGLTFMKGDYAHSGFPETAYDKMATTMIERGYKVARVEQTETPAMLEKRCELENKKTKFDKVVRREVCQITNLGTQMFSTGQCSMSKGQFSSNANYLLAIAETKNRYGIAFVDTTIGDFVIGEFDDDQQCSRLLTLLSLYTPVLILHERIGMSESTFKVIKNIDALKEKLTNEKQFWNASKTLKFLSENYYKSESDWPEVLKEMQSAHLEAAKDSTLAFKALGGCLWYLNHNLLDQQVLALATFKRYIPPDENKHNSIVSKKRTQSHMMLDAITLHNLNINGKDNSLFMKVDFCSTQFGKRLLMDFICSPSCDIHEIRGRQEAVNELTQNMELLSSCRGLLSSLNVDVERSLAQIHQLGNMNISKNHPSARAILYEAVTYGKNKIIDFAAALNAFDQLMNLPKIFEDCQSNLLKVLTQTNDNGGQFIDLSREIEKLRSSFDIEKAKATGYIIPGRNADEDYDAVLNEIDDLESELKVYLKSQEKVIGCKLSYFGSDRKRYQIEVPENNLKKVPSEYTLETSKGKGKNAVFRYSTDETKEYLKRMQELEAKKKDVLDDFGRKIFEKFSKNYMQYKKIVSLTAKLDVIASLAEYSRNLSNSCIPDVYEIAEKAGESFIKIENGIHPLMNANDYIANSIDIGMNSKYFHLITGANAGGKSTFMRQTALLTILAQIGSLVPADSMSLTLVDRIFTRLGANDNIMQNQSTFLVELNETSIILKHCTFNSLVVLDELGRGTSTYDGTAIARSVANYLADIKCITLFSTHYHSLVDDFRDDERIFLGHMACVVENENNEDITKESITFLYKYVQGSCPRSFGFNAAKLAGIDHSIIRRAFEISKKVEAESLRHRIKAKILQGAAKEDIEKLVIKFKKCFY